MSVFVKVSVHPFLKFHVVVLLVGIPQVSTGVGLLAMFPVPDTVNLVCETLTAPLFMSGDSEAHSSASPTPDRCMFPPSALRLFSVAPEGEFTEKGK